MVIVQELCESRGGRPGLSVLTSLMVSVDVIQYWSNHVHALNHVQLVPNNYVNRHPRTLSKTGRNHVVIPWTVYIGPWEKPWTCVGSWVIPFQSNVSFWSCVAQVHLNVFMLVNVSLWPYCSLSDTWTYIYMVRHISVSLTDSFQTATQYHPSFSPPPPPPPVCYSQSPLPLLTSADGDQTLR